MAKVRTTADQIRSLKDTLPKGTPDNVVIVQNGRQPHLYMYTDTHSWKCYCDTPDTTRKYFIKRTDRDPLHLESAVYEHGYMVPNKAKKAWNKSDTTAVDISNRYSYTSQAVRESEEEENEPDQQSQPINPATGAAENNKKTVETSTGKKGKKAKEHRPKKKKRVVVIDLSTGPITARKPFRVSSAHWASGRHTQQWPWKGTLQCRLVTQSGNQHSAWSRHTHCWAHKK